MYKVLEKIVIRLVCGEISRSVWYFKQLVCDQSTLSGQVQSKETGEAGPHLESILYSHLPEFHCEAEALSIIDRVAKYLFGQPRAHYLS